MTDAKIDPVKFEELTPEELNAVTGGHKGRPSSGAGGANKTGQLGNYSSHRHQGRGPR
jgi:bacteriocin-like protein